MTAWVVPLLLAGALPPSLLHAMRAAREHNHALGISRAQLLEQQALYQQTLAALLPSFQSSGNYTRNQFEAVLHSAAPGVTGLPPGNIPIVLLNQFTGTVGLNVPLIHPGNLTRRAEQGASVDSAQKALLAADAEILLETARVYYQVVAAQEVLEAAQRAVATAEEGLRVSSVQLSAGTANPLSVERAKLDVARAKQTQANARRTLGLSRKNLETLTGETLNGNLPPLSSVDSPPERERDYVDRALRNRPEIAQALADIEQARLSRREAWLQLAPNLSATAQEHFTNATGFLGKAAYWTVGATLNWTVDPVGVSAAVRRADAVLEERRQRLMQTQDAARDEVHQAWLDIEANRARFDEAAVEVQSAKVALDLTLHQYIAGTATSFDLSQAQRDAFNADATRAQSGADLATSLLSLRKAAGEPLLEEE